MPVADIIRRTGAGVIAGAALAVATMAANGHAAPGRPHQPAAPATRLAPVAVTLTAADGVRIDGLLYRSAAPKATILLFHQAGSGKGEYASVAPRLAAAGYDALAIDQRAGGGLFGVNATATRLGHPANYGEARRDLEAAFAWGARRGRPVILWGSSYSAALVFEVAAAHPGGVAAVLAFSPGEYLADKGEVRRAAARVSVPIYVTSAPERVEVAAARAILAASPARVKAQYVPAAGVHGASTLIPARNPAGAAANWAAVWTFLRGLGPAGR